MRKTLEERRLDAIKSKFKICSTQCRCCKDTINLEKMWLVHRWGVNKRVYPWYYCSKCMPTAQDVLKEIDNDACPFGIAFVDSHFKPNDQERTLETLMKLKEAKKKKNKKKS